MLGVRSLIRATSRVTGKQQLRVAAASTNTKCSLHSAAISNSDNRINFNRRQPNFTSHGRSFYTATPLFADVEIVKVPAFAESITEGDLRWIKQAGDAVELDETVAEVETDKTSVPINSPCAGVLTKTLVEDGATVTPGTDIFHVEKGAAGASPAPAKEAAAPTPVAAAPSPPPASTPTPAPVAAASPPPPAATPKPPTAPLSAVPVASIQHSSFISQAEVKIPPADYRTTVTGTRTEQRHKMTRMRIRIAERLKHAQNTYAMLTTFNDVDMSNLMELRKSVQKQFVEKHGVKLGLMSAFVKASGHALMHSPVVNAVIEGNEIVYRDYVDISIAVSTPKGLVVPVVRNVESMSFADIELAIAALGEKARRNAIAVEDMDGGTFSVSNGGVFGSVFGTPIINPPQSAILGMHGIFDTPVAVNGQVVIRPMMKIALTYDHRLIDGKEAVTFLKHIKTSVEDPRRMLCDI